MVNSQFFSKKIKKGWLITWIALATLIITNPSLKRFKDFHGDSGIDTLRRTKNFILFSIYSNGRDNFIGVFWNFFYIGEDNRPYYYRSESQKSKINF